MTQAFVGLGANLGDPLDTIERTLNALEAEPDIALTGVSALYRSAPLEAQGPDFLNAVCSLETTLDADALLGRLQALEQRFGRERPYRNAPRTLDLDLLTFGAERRDSERLTLPHPRMHERAFVLRPLADLAPLSRLTMPDGSERPLSDLLAAVSGQRIERAHDAPKRCVQRP